MGWDSSLNSGRSFANRASAPDYYGDVCRKFPKFQPALNSATNTYAGSILAYFRRGRTAPYVPGSWSKIESPVCLQDASKLGESFVPRRLPWDGPIDSSTPRHMEHADREL